LPEFDVFSRKMQTVRDGEFNPSAEDATFFAGEVFEATIRPSPPPLLTTTMKWLMAIAGKPLPVAGWRVRRLLGCCLISTCSRKPASEISLRTSIQVIDVS
jgi:hypothetical protein